MNGHHLKPAPGTNASRVCLKCGQTFTFHQLERQKPSVRDEECPILPNGERNER